MSAGTRGRPADTGPYLGVSASLGQRLGGPERLAAESPEPSAAPPPRGAAHLPLHSSCHNARRRAPPYSRASKFESGQ